MGCAVITGASSGLGEQFALIMPEIFPEINELWLVGRREVRLTELCDRLLGIEAHCISADLTDTAGLSRLQQTLDALPGEIDLLINCAGCGYLDTFYTSGLSEQLEMVNLNIRGLTAVTHMALPKIRKGGRIINISSIASFVPTPRMTVYSASKAYVSAFSRGLHQELRERKISVTAICPGPMNTDFLSIGRIAGNSKTFATIPYDEPSQVAEGALRAAKKRHAVYTPSVIYKIYRVLSGILPQALLVKLSKT